jgi:hypothetical protein
VPDFGSILRHLSRPRKPNVGDLYWVENEHLGIDDPNTEDHPVVVIAGQHLVGGPVTVAIGSSSRMVMKGHVILEVRPEDCEAGARLDCLTRFWMNENLRLEAEKLGRSMGRLGQAKIEELKRLKGSKII